MSKHTNQNLPKMFNPKDHYKRDLSTYAREERQTLAIIAAVAIFTAGFVLSAMFEAQNYDLLLSLGGAK